MFRLASVAALALLAVSVTPASAAPYCTATEPPHYNDGFLELWGQLAGSPGQPSTCVFGDPKGTGDTLQLTDRGLFFYRRSTNTPTYTDGIQHWAMTADRGVVTWSGQAIDPPADAFLWPPSRNCIYVGQEC